MKINVVLKDLSFCDGVLTYEDVCGYNVDTEKGFLIIDYDHGKRIYIRLVEMLYFRIF